MRRVALILAAIPLFAFGNLHNKSPAELQPSGQSYTSADVERALNDAEQFARDGKYAQALERHIWYHKNALKYDQAQTGVRLSFALADWVQLGAQYPPALHELRVIRNETQATWRKNPTDTSAFDDVVSIDFALNDMKSAKLLFYESRKNDLGDYFQIDLRQILASGDMKWAKDVVGDPMVRLKALKSKHEMGARALVGHKEMAKENDRFIAGRISELVSAVTQVDGAKTGRKVQEKAMKLFTSPEMKKALSAN